MTRLRLVLSVLAALTAVAWWCAPAGASILTYGVAPDKMKPGCVGKSHDATCRAVTRTTVYQLQNDTRTAPVQVKRAGWLVALSLSMGQPTKAQIHFFNTNYGGTSRASLAVLRPGGKRLQRTLVAQTDLVHLQPYFGGVSDFAVTKALRVKKGDFIGLNVPTWAPILAVGQAATYSWRASRPSNQCGDSFLATPLFIDTVGQDAAFGCKYTTGRVTYSATEVTSPRKRFDSNQNPIK